MQMEAISRARENEMSQQERQFADEGKTIEQMFAESGRQSEYDAMKRQGFDFNTPQYQGSAQFTGEMQGGIMPNGVKVTQTFGQYSPYDVHSKNRNWGVDFAVKEGTPIALPKGEWEVVEAFAGAKGRGRIGDSTNKGYGNSVMVRNRQTGEMMRFSHLSGVNVQAGQVYKGGSVIGKSGATGNVTGAHLDLEYRNPSGQLADVLRSPYAQQLFASMGRI